MSAPDYKAEFLKVFDRIGLHHSRHERFGDLLELATCAVRKTTLPPGPDADALEQRYMNVVARYAVNDIRAMPELLALTQLAVNAGGCDFLGSLATELELLDSKLGQFITPYEVSRLMAEMTFMDAGAVISERGFITLQEPASGAGGMVLAAADVLQTKGFDPASTLYVEAADVASLCFKMTYLQLAARGIPATVFHRNTLSLKDFDKARTPAFLPFYVRHLPALKRWREESHEACAPVPPPPAAAVQGDLFGGTPEPDRPSRRPRSRKDPGPDL
jgi:hypothetical protein